LTQGSVGHERKDRTWIGIALMVVLLGATLIGVNLMVREATRPRLGALDCSQLEDDVTRTVCRQTYTRNLDRTLAQDYHAAMATASGEVAKALEDAHAEFLRKRAACFPANTPVELPVVYRCVEGVYQEAIAALKAKHPR